MCEERLYFYPMMSMCIYDMLVIKIGRDLTNLLITNNFIASYPVTRTSVVTYGQAFSWILTVY